MCVSSNGNEVNYADVHPSFPKGHTYVYIKCIA